MTYLNIINSVLRRLRDDEVSNFTDSGYSLLIGDFVNETKREVEDAWNWSVLKDRVIVNCVASQQQYTLTGAGNRSRILQVLNDSQDTVMQLAPQDWMRRQTLLTDSTEASPIYYNLEGQTSGDPDVKFWPIPDTTDVIEFQMIIPQEDLSNNNTELVIPEWPVILGAYAKAISERGEDGSTQFAEAIQAYRNAMADAIAIDSRRLPHEIVWEVV